MSLLRAVLMLSDGRQFRGKSFGAHGETMGEVCFNTGMTGYQEILTDPSYSGQIVVMTYPHVGNYGVNPEDVESSRIQVAGFAVRKETVLPSNYRSNESLGDYLRREGVTGIQEIDTRALTRHIRSRGAMNGIISTTDLDPASLLKKLESHPSMTGRDLVRSVSCSKSYEWESGGQDHANTKDNEFPNLVACIDFGIKYSILRLFENHGCRVTVFPATASAEDILETQPQGIFLSNGPGDPAAVTYGIKTVKRLLGKRPIFGICLGHQILALAQGGKTFKLKFGHHGMNHPVKNLRSGRVEITTQNHGFAVDPDSLPSGLEITHWNLNDDTMEGLRCSDIPAFSVQYHPEAGPGPHDSRYLFHEFVDMMNKEHAESIGHSYA